MFEQAARELGIDLAAQRVIGDRASRHGGGARASARCASSSTATTRRCPESTTPCRTSPRRPRCSPAAPGALLTWRAMASRLLSRLRYVVGLPCSTAGPGRLAPARRRDAADRRRAVAVPRPRRVPPGLVGAPGAPRPLGAGGRRASCRSPAAGRRVLRPRRLRRRRSRCWPPGSSGPSGRVVAFEPDPGRAPVLERNLAANGADERDRRAVRRRRQARAPSASLRAATPSATSASAGSSRCAQVTLDGYCASTTSAHRDEGRHRGRRGRRADGSAAVRACARWCWRCTSRSCASRRSTRRRSSTGSARRPARVARRRQLRRPRQAASRA